jgi:hypothetical protein
MENVDEEEQSGKEFDFSLMEVKLNLFKLFFGGANIAKSFQNVTNVRTSA